MEVLLLLSLELQLATNFKPEKAQFFSMYSHNIITSRSKPLQVCSNQMPGAHTRASAFASAPNLSPEDNLQKAKGGYLPLSLPPALI